MTVRPVRRGRANTVQPAIDQIIQYAPGGGSGTGDVVGPGSSTSGHLPVFGDGTGKLLSDSGDSIADVVTAAVVAAIAAILPVDLASEVTGSLPWAGVSKTGSSLADLATRSATDLASGTLPDARFPATLPAASGANLTSLAAANLSGTIASAVQDAITRLGIIASGSFANGALKLKDSNASHDLIITPTSNITADRIISLITGDVARSLNLGAAVSYTPVWASSGTPPTLGASTLLGSYVQLGKFVYFRVLMVFGAGFSWGTGAHRISLPVGCAISDANLCLTQGLIAGGRYPGVGILTASDAVLFNNANPAGLWSSTAPAVWATTHQFSVFGFYDESGS